jgi:hypothetical protein
MMDEKRDKALQFLLTASRFNDRDAIFRSLKVDPGA